MVENLALMLRIREVPGSDLGQETSYPVWGFSWFLSVPLGEYRNITLQLVHDRFLPNPFQFIIRRYIVLVVEKASFNKLQTNNLTLSLTLCIHLFFYLWPTASVLNYFIIYWFLAYFQKMKVGLPNHKSVCLSVFPH
jgi:hypothetical protein